jgi:hypothetical protein
VAYSKVFITAKFAKERKGFFTTKKKERKELSIKVQYELQTFTPFHSFLRAQRKAKAFGYRHCEEHFFNFGSTFTTIATKQSYGLYFVNRSSKFKKYPPQNGDKASSNAIFRRQFFPSQAKLFSQIWAKKYPSGGQDSQKLL